VVNPLVKGEGAAPAARRVARESLGRAIAVENHPLLRLLYNHPDGVDIISRRRTAPGSRLYYVRSQRR
jgi:hypothetical protein